MIYWAIFSGSPAVFCLFLLQLLSQYRPQKYYFEVKKIKALYGGRSLMVITITGYASMNTLGMQFVQIMVGDDLSIADT